MTPSTFGTQLKRWRTTAGLTQAQLAEAIGVGEAYVSKLETGREEPSLTTIFNAGKSLGVELKDALAAAGRCDKCGAKPAWDEVPS